MSFKKNILANYASQLYVTAAGIIMVPMYIKYMGAEAYGLVGFFAMLQAWFNLLDLGLSPTISRESARYHGGAMSALEYRRIFRALSVIFSTVSLLGGGSLWLLANVISTQWLKIETLALSDVVLAVEIMAISVALRWMTGLYRGVVSGAERLVWLSSFNALIASLRFVVVLGSMWIWGYTPRVFFIHQLIVASLEFLGLFLMCQVLLPDSKKVVEPIGWSFRPVQPLLKFSLTIAFTSSVWVLVTQTDKLLLSNILPLGDYGYFTLAVLVASGIMVISGPISNAIMPRMARLQAEGKHDQLISAYRQATQMVAVVAIPVTLVLVFFSHHVLMAWTNNEELANKAAPVLALYAAGYGVLSISAFPYYLQYAKGDLKLHLIGNLIILFTLIPSIVWAATHYGIAGPGWAWFMCHALYLGLWIPFIHHRFAPGLHWSWLVRDILLPITPPIICAILINTSIQLPNTRITLIIALTSIGTTLFMLGLIFATRIKLFNREKHYAERKIE